MKLAIFQWIQFFVLWAGMISYSACQFKDSNPESKIDFSADSVGIIGGTRTSTQDHPYIVNLWLDSPKDLFVGHLCGGSLVHSRWVLTAAHCVLQEASSRDSGTIRLNELSLYMGSNHISGRGSPGILKAKSIHVHPEFKWPHFDVALIELQVPVENISPVLLNTEALSDFSSSAMALGWGLTDEEGRLESEWLLQIELPLITREECRSDAYVKQKAWPIGSDMICTRTGLGQRATCEGDSGGPLIQKRNGRDVQIGIISWGSACRPAFRGRQANVEGYADVSSAYPWIQKTIRVNSGDPSQ